MDYGTREIPTIDCHAVQRIVPLGNGQAAAIMVKREVAPDGTVIEIAVGQVTFPIESISDCIGLMMSCLMEAGLNRVVSTIKRNLGHAFH
jgi:hypothetical protein